MSFVNIHSHSHYSNNGNMDSIAKVSDIVDRAKELGQTAVGLTDHGTISGLIDLYKECNKKGIKPLLGAEFYWCPDVTIKDRSSLRHLVIIAKNQQGYFNLLKLMTISHQNTYYKPRVDMEILRQHSEGLIVTSACLGGILKTIKTVEKQNIIEHEDGELELVGWHKEEVFDYELAEDRASEFKELFGEDFYIEIHTNQMKEQMEHNKFLVELSEKLDIPLIACVDSHYVHVHQADTHRKFIGISDDNEGSYYQTDDYFIMSAEQVQEKLSYLPQGIVSRAIFNTTALAEKCNVAITFGEKNYPNFPVQDQVEAVKEICRKGWKEKIIPHVPKHHRTKYEKQVKHELNILEKAEYLNYFLICNDFLSECKRRGIRTGIGRGSVVGSLIAYLMDITKLDPVKYDLVFERFCTLERISPPDIDMDICKNRRQEAIEYIREKYGDVYHVRTFSYMGAKGALRRAGQALKIPQETVNALSKEIKESLDNIKTTKGNEELIALAKEFENCIQGFSSHASAIMVFPKDPNNWCAVEKQGDNFVVSYDFTDLEEQGLLKLDVLGLKTLDVIQETLDLIGEKECEKFDIDHLHEFDQKAFDMLCEGGTAGCFQIEGQGMTELVKAMQPKHYRDLVPLVALYRPGCLEAGMVDVFVKRRQGEEEVEYLHPQMEQVLSDTYGVILYQEQIQKLANVLAGYSLGEADLLRRAVGKKKPEEMAKIKPDFIKRAVETLVPSRESKAVNKVVPIIEKIWELIEFFAGYGFNKSHSAGYGYISYQTAFLKAHYPVAYITALLNVYNDEAQIDMLPYIDECRRLGIEILPPDINKSQCEWTMERLEDGTWGIRVGFSYIKGVGKLDIVRPVNNFIDFMEKNPKIVKTKAQALIKAGCFGDNDKGLMLAQLEWFKISGSRKEECVAKIKKYTEEGKERYVQQWKEKLANIPGIETVKPQKVDEVMSQREVLAFSFKDVLNSYDLSFCVSPCVESKREHIIGGEVVRFKKINDKKGRAMAFVTVRTQSVTVQLVMFANYFTELIEGQVYLFSIQENKIKDVREARIVNKAS